MRTHVRGVQWWLRVVLVFLAAGLAPRCEAVRNDAVRKKVGVTVYKREKCYHGYTLLCQSYEDVSLTKDGTGEVYLIDMDGRVVHDWKVRTALQSFCRLLPNGNLLYPTRDRSNLFRAGLRE
jgi:hypothetical protein